MKAEKTKKISRAAIEHSFHEMMGVQKELKTSYKEASAFFIGIFLFLCGFLFNLSANIVYDLIKGSVAWRIFVLLATTLSLVFLIMLVRKYVLVPIVEQKEKLKKIQKETRITTGRITPTFDDLSEK